MSGRGRRRGRRIKERVAIIVLVLGKCVKNEEMIRVELKYGEIKLVIMFVF